MNDLRANNIADPPLESVEQACGHAPGRTDDMPHIARADVPLAGLIDVLSATPASDDGGKRDGAEEIGEDDESKLGWDHDRGPPSHGDRLQLDIYSVARC